MVTKAEQKMGYKLPVKYLELLKIQNGGYIRYTIPDASHEKIYGIGPSPSSIISIAENWLDELDNDAKSELKGLIPFDDDGHWFICFDYRENKNEPCITVICPEMDEEESIADNFDEYLEMLELEIDNEFVIETSLSLEETVKKVEKILKAQFESVAKDVRGYTFFKTKYKESAIYVEPNKVPNGLISPDDNGYEEMKHLMEGTALRFPELRENDLIITIYEDNQEEVLSKLVSNSIKVCALRDLV